MPTGQPLLDEWSNMFKSPLVLPLTLIFAGVLAFMATTGILPPQVLRFWPIIFVILGLVGLVSLSSDELMGETTSSTKKSSGAKSTGTTKKKSAATKSSSKSTSAKKTSSKKKTTKKSSKK